MILITCSIDAHDKRDVETTDIPGANHNTDIDELVVMVLLRALSDILNLTYTILYRKLLVIGRNGKPILYVKLQKAMYGYIWAKLLFYEKLSRYLKSMGFVITSMTSVCTIKFSTGNNSP